MVKLQIHPFLFFPGFFSASLLWVPAKQAFPIWAELFAGVKEKQEASKQRKSSTVEESDPSALTPLELTLNTRSANADNR